MCSLSSSGVWLSNISIRILRCYSLILPVEYRIVIVELFPLDVVRIIRSPSRNNPRITWHTLGMLFLRPSSRWMSPEIRSIECWLFIDAKRILSCMCARIRSAVVMEDLHSKAFGEWSFNNGWSTAIPCTPSELIKHLRAGIHSPSFFPFNGIV